MEPQVGVTYYTTMKWNYEAMPRVVTRIDGDTLWYRLIGGITDDPIRFSVSGFKRAVASGMWYLPFPAILMLPAGV